MCGSIYTQHNGQWEKNALSGKTRQLTRKIDGQHFTPAAADLVDGVTILHGRAAHQTVEARQEDLLELGEQVTVVFCLE